MSERTADNGPNPRQVVFKQPLTEHSPGHSVGCRGAVTLGQEPRRSWPARIREPARPPRQGSFNPTSSGLGVGLTMNFPFAEGTLGEKLEAGTGLSVYCLNCKESAILNVAELVRRLGANQSCMQHDLVKVIFCQECRKAGRDDRNLQFTNHVRTPDE
ncbi:hypothetical protein [Mesorhizobium sp.]|uniref:hypothetical protein n=2 Tax=Mesorhizobium TaxID=68287 RepID=UPI000FEA576D|nr:hypothetical protein [Mesorhizobium sp.]RWF22762.1 MAG: hypothetical protein EOS64_13475 [Mesorhizobium sp.]